jgi:hypothetical protein
LGWTAGSWLGASGAVASLQARRRSATDAAISFRYDPVNDMDFQTQLVASYGTVAGGRPMARPARGER